MKYKIEEFSINNYRSISKLRISPTSDNFLIVCGSNNVGKTNFLRALNLFFNPTVENFDAERDIPYNIVEGSRGGGYKTTLKVKIRELKTNTLYTITQVFKEEKNLTEKEIVSFLEKNFKFFFVEASNVNIPKLISEIVNEEILPLGLDKRRGKNQQASLKKLNEFIEQSRLAVGQIETQLTKIFRDLLEDVESIDSKDWKLQIKFPEYQYFREAIANMIEFTLFDTNERKLETKGSGIQRTVLLSLIKYVNSRTTKDIIWAIDEPEAFLQAGLQKNLYYKLLEESKSSQIVITTHSYFFININDLKNTFLFEGTKESIEYKRKEGTFFYKVDTEVYTGSSFEQAEKIKENFGISKNDSWEIMPYNVLVEGQEDKDLFIALMKNFNLPIPNILVAGGVDKYIGFLQFVNDYCSELEYTPKVLAIFDKDGAGRNKYNLLVKKSYEHFELRCEYIIRYDNCNNKDIELEDFVYPELIFDAVNKILRKRKYTIIKKVDRENRTALAYNNKPILEYITEVCRQNNSDKKEINFDSLSMKLFLSTTICNLIDKTNLDEHDKKYSKVKEFLQMVSGN